MRFFSLQSNEEKKPVKSYRKKLMVLLSSLAVLILGAIPVLASEGGGTGGMDTVTSSLTSTFSEVATKALSLITTMLPVVLPIMGAMVLIRIGIRVFKQLSGKAGG